MSILNWLFGKPSFHRYEDSFALTRELLWAAIQKATEQCLSDGQLVVLVTHFPSTFERLQKCIGEWETDYCIVDRTMDQNWFTHLADSDFKKVHLVLSDFLTSFESGPVHDLANRQMALLVCERHPNIAHDHLVETFARTVPIPTQLGYFLALDDLVVKNTIEAGTITVLLQLGMNEHELITSRMVKRRIDKILKRQMLENGTDHRADSPGQWYALNRAAK